MLKPYQACRVFWLLSDPDLLFIKGNTYGTLPGFRNWVPEMAIVKLWASIFSKETKIYDFR